MSKLQMLFDYQKISENDKLNNIINDTLSRYNDAIEIEDDELELAAGGQAMQVVEKMQM